MRGSLLVVVASRGGSRRGTVGANRRLWAGQIDGEAVVTGQLGGLGVGIAFESAGYRQVQASAGGSAGCRDQSLANQRMREGDRLPHRRQLVDEALRERLAHSALGLRGGQSGRPSGERHRRRGTDRGNGREETLGFGIQAGEALLDQVGDRIGGGGAVECLALRQRAAAVEVAHQLTGEKGVAGSASLEPRRQPRGDPAPHPGVDQSRHAVGVEPLEAQLLEIPGAAQVGEDTGDRVAATHLSVAHRHDQDQRQVSVFEQVGQGLSGSGVAPVGVVEHDVKRRPAGRPQQCRADAVQESVAGALGGDHLAGTGLLGNAGMPTQLGHERRQLRPRRPGKSRPPLIVATARELADRPHPGLKGHNGLWRATGEYDNRPLCTSLRCRGGGVTSLADPGFAQDQHRPSTLARRSQLFERRDLTIAPDQRLFGVGGEDPR